MRTSSMTSFSCETSPRPLSFGSHESNFPSSCLNLNEHMKKTQRQKMTSTIGTTLIATGFSSGSCEPAIAWIPVALHRRAGGLRALPPAFSSVRSLRRGRGRSGSLGLRGADGDLVETDRRAALDDALDVGVG